MERSGDNIGGGEPVAGSGLRWSPTKEQISILEGMYKQGIRTPSAEQIQDITGRLRAYGHIEGKNVFYWFQNHKARQRQKQKQERMANYSAAGCTPTSNPFCDHHPPVPCTPPSFLLHPPCPLPPSFPRGVNVIYNRYCMAQGNDNCYSHQQKGEDKSGIRSPEKVNPLPAVSFVDVGTSWWPEAMNRGLVLDWDTYENKNKTLNLFPLQPTGILESKKHEGSRSTSADENFNTNSQMNGGADHDNEDSRGCVGLFSRHGPKRE